MKFLRLGGAVFAGLVLSVVFAASAHAATFTVDSTGDESAVDPSVACNTALDTCTLRSAIEAANAQAGADTIEFNISGAGVHTFTPASAYPDITEQVTIDGSTQPGASCGTLVPASLPAGSNTPHTLLIEVDASGIGFTSNLRINSSGASSSVIRGLVLNRATSGSAVLVDNSATDITIECNYIGTSADGTSASANYYGITIVNDVQRVTIQNNLVSGHTNYGIDIGRSTEHTIQNNLVGTASDGKTQLANGGDWVKHF